MMHAVVERAHALMRTGDYEICACACHAVTAAATTPLPPAPLPSWWYECRSVHGDACRAVAMRERSRATSSRERSRAGSRAVSRAWSQAARSSSSVEDSVQWFELKYNVSSSSNI